MTRKKELHPRTITGGSRLYGSEEDALAALVPEGDCLVWPHGLQHGYGYVNFGAGDGVRVHILAWHFVNGPVPDGHELHHTCENKPCGNAEHLEALTHQEHGFRHRRTHCYRGHLMTPENAVINKRRGTRQCRECARRHWRESKQRLALKGK